MIDRNLERLLGDASRGVAYPPTPELSSRVVEALVAPARRRGLVLRPALAGLLAAVLVLVAALAIAPSRDALARLFGVEGSKVEFLPTPLPGQTATPFPTADPNLTPDPRDVSPVELADLPELVGFAAALPAVDEERIKSSLLFYGHDAVLVHEYPRFELWQSRIEGHASFGKLAPPWLRVRETEVGDWPALWLSGGEHFVSYVDSTGGHIPSSQRIVERNTLIWRTDAFFYRIETDLSLEEALRVAQTLP